MEFTYSLACGWEEALVFSPEKALALLFLGSGSLRSREAAMAVCSGFRFCFNFINVLFFFRRINLEE